MKKLISLLLSLVMAFSFALSVSAKTYGDYEFKVLSDKTIKIISYYRENAKKVTIPSKIEGKKVTVIGDYAFLTTEKIKTLKLGKYIKKIGMSAFEDCISLKKVTIPNSVKIIDDDAFSSCEKLKGVKIGKKVKIINDYAFHCCESLKSVTIPKNVKKIGFWAFGYYYNDDIDAISKVKGFTIKGYKGTAASKYAMKNGFKFKEIK